MYATVLVKGGPLLLWNTVLLQAAHRTTDYMYIDTGVENSSLYRAATAGLAAKL